MYEIFVFQNLERDGTVDYGRLNQELTVTTGNTLSPEGPVRGAGTLAAVEDIDDDEDLIANKPHTHREMSEKTEVWNIRIYIQMNLNCCIVHAVMMFCEQYWSCLTK